MPSLSEFGKLVERVESVGPDAQRAAHVGLNGVHAPHEAG
jgi:hypothetical protein